MPRADADTLTALLDAHADTRGDRPAVISGGTELGFAALRDGARALARGLAAQGIGQGDTVGLICANRAEWVLTVCAAARLGARVAAFNTWARAWDLGHMLERSRCRVLVAQAGLRGADLAATLREIVPEAFAATDRSWRSAAAPELRGIFLIGEGGEGTAPGLGAFDELASPDEAAAEPEPTAAEPLLVVYTSGSTARPKAVPIRQDLALDHAREVAGRMGVDGNDRIWVPVPLFWSYGGVNAMMVGLATGATLVLQETFDAGAAVRLLRDAACTTGYLLPNITAALLAEDGIGVDSFPLLAKGMTIGSPRDVRLAAEGLGIPAICNAYGSTELYACCCMTPADWPLERKAEHQGPPLPGNAVSIRDPETGAALEPGEVGEICVTGYTCDGYDDAPDSTASAFAADGAFRTGDLGAMDEAGVLTFAARAGDMIRTGGINVAPAEVEEYLRRHSGVKAVCVTGIPHPVKGEMVAAWIVRAHGETAAAELRAHCAAGIAGYKVPAHFHLTDEALPQTDTGKIARARVEERLAEIFAARDEA